MSSKVALAPTPKSALSRIPVRKGATITQPSNAANNTTTAPAPVSAAPQQRPKPILPTSTQTNLNNSLNTSLNTSLTSNNSFEKAPQNTSFSDVATPGRGLKSGDDKKNKAAPVMTNKENVANGAKKPAPEVKVKGYTELKRSEELLLAENKRLSETFKCVEAERDHAIQQVRIEQANFKTALLDKDHQIAELCRSLECMKQQLIDLDNDWKCKYAENERQHKEKLSSEIAAYTKRQCSLQTELAESSTKMKKLEDLLADCAIDPVSLQPFEWRNKISADEFNIVKQLQDDIEEMEQQTQDFILNVHPKFTAEMKHFKTEWLSAMTATDQITDDTTNNLLDEEALRQLDEEIASNSHSEQDTTYSSCMDEWADMHDELTSLPSDPSINNNSFTFDENECFDMEGVTI